MSNYKSKNLLRDCPICECKKGEVLHTQSFVLAEGIFLPESYDIASCVVCGFVFADTRAKQKDYDAYYQNSSKYESCTTSLGSGVTEHDHRRLEDTAKTISNFFPNESSSILDVGSANGGLLSEMKKLNYTSLSGLDPSPACISYMSKIGIEGLLGGLFTDNSNLHKKFDGVLLTHVLEHIYDVRMAITNALNFLKDEGILYLEVPDSSRYKDFFISPFYFFDIEHINHFDPDSLVNLFSLFNGNILEIGQKDMPISKSGFIPAVYIVFQKNKNKTNQKIKQSIVSKDSVLKHIKESAVVTYLPEVNDLVISKTPVIVWGAGQATQRSLRNTALGDTNILFFVDNDKKKQGIFLKGKEVFSPNKIKEMGDAVIIVCSGLHGNEIEEQIKSMKLENKVLLVA